MSVQTSLQLLGVGEHKVARLGGVAPVGPDVSWCPPGFVGWQPINAYLIQDGDSAVLVDTGVGAHVADVLQQLRTLLSPATSLSVILTRTEMECCLNLPAIEREFDVDQVWYTGGITVPVSTAAARRISVDAGSSIELEAAPGITVTVYSPLLRLLPVLWVGEQRSRTLLTSDSFCHRLTDASGGELPYDVRALRAFHDLKFGWISEANSEADSLAIAENVQAILGGRDWEAVGPGYGAPLVGKHDISSQAAELVSHLRGVGLHAA